MFLGMPLNTNIWAIMMKSVNAIPLILFLFLMLPFLSEYIPKNDVLGGIIYFVAFVSMIILPFLCIGALIMYFLGYFPNYFYSPYPYISILFVIFKIF